MEDAGQRESEPVLDAVAEQVRLAADELYLALANEAGPWTARELQGHLGDYSSSVASLAFWRLVDAGDLVVGNDLTVSIPSRRDA